MKHWNGFEGTRSWFNQGATLVFAEGTEENRQKTSVGKASILAGIRNIHLPNTSQEPYL